MFSECLDHHREEQREVFCTPDGELVGGVIVDDLWNCIEGGTVLAEDVLPITRLRELHMHEAVTAPKETDQNKKKHTNW